MSTFKYTPYADGIQSFSIGLSLLDRARWIEPDELLVAELAKKEQLLIENPAQVIAAEPDTEAAQAEVRDTLVNYLLTHHPDSYELRSGDTGREITIKPANRRVALDEGPPLVAAARLIQDDLCLMRRSSEGWRLVAAVLTAPSSWSLAEQFGKPLGQIHRHVPGFAGSMAARVERIFDNLHVDRPVWRMNWSLYDDDVLFHPETKQETQRWQGPSSDLGENTFLRIERQTLHRMADSGDILFTIRVYVDPVAAFRSHPAGDHLAAELIARLSELDEAQLRYKNLLADRDKIIAALRANSGNGGIGKAGSAGESDGLVQGGWTKRSRAKSRIDQ